MPAMQVAVISEDRYCCIDIITPTAPAFPGHAHGGTLSGIEQTAEAVFSVSRSDLFHKPIIGYYVPEIPLEYPQRPGKRANRTK